MIEDYRSFQADREALDRKVSDLLDRWEMLEIRAQAEKSKEVLRDYWDLRAKRPTLMANLVPAMACMLVWAALIGLMVVVLK